MEVCSTVVSILPLLGITMLVILLSYVTMIVAGVLWYVSQIVRRADTKVEE